MTVSPFRTVVILGDLLLSWANRQALVNGEGLIVELIGDIQTKKRVTLVKLLPILCLHSGSPLSTRKCVHHPRLSVTRLLLCCILVPLQASSRLASPKQAGPTRDCPHSRLRSWLSAPSMVLGRWHARPHTGPSANVALLDETWWEPPIKLA